MAQRWTFEEDYFICKFSFQYAYDNISERDINNIVLEMKERGFTSRSVSAIVKRFKAYRHIFNYYDFYLVGKLPSNPRIDRSYSLSISGNVSTVQSVAQQWGITFSSNSTNVRDDVACTPEFGYVAKLIHQGFGHLSYS